MQPLRLPPQDPHTSDSCVWSDLYLPGDILPLEYSLYLAVHALSAGWEYPGAGHAGSAGAHRSSSGVDHVWGHVDIVVGNQRLATYAQSPCVVLHAAGMNITGVYYTLPGRSNRVQGRAVFSDDSLEQVILHFDAPLPGAQRGGNANVTLHLSFEYALEEGLDGLYKSVYDGASGPGTIVSTQMEPTSARRAFPCFDEPALRAHFSVTVATAPGLSAVLGNMPQVSQSRAPSPAPAGASPASVAAAAWGMTETAFERTPSMPTYLVALVMGQLESQGVNCSVPRDRTVPPAASSSAAAAAVVVPVRVWATPGNAGQLDAALAVGCLSLQTYAYAFGLGYQLPKLDLIGIPALSAGAMENWGLITFRESSLLVDARDDDVAEEHKIALTVAHEICHQWFGDLVTVSDWTELWLKEGFATYFENLAAQAFRPGFGYWDIFYSDTTASALADDASPSVHPLSLGAPMRSRAQVDNMYDAISYEKGGSVLRMLRAYLAYKGTGMPATAPFGQLPIRRALHEDESGPAAAAAAASGAHLVAASKQVPMRRALHGDKSSPAAAASGAGLAGPSGQLPKRRALRGDGDEDRPPAVLTGPAAGTDVSDPLMGALSDYLKRHGYGAVTQRQLWASLSQSTGEHLTDLMEAWATQPGFPVVSVSLPGDGTVALSQRPVVGKGGAAPACGDDDGQAQWQVPVALRAAVATTAGAAPGPVAQWRVLQQCREAFALNGLGVDAGVEYVLANANRYGYYRTNYSEAAWAAIIRDAAYPERLPAADFAGLLDDAYQLSYLGQLSPTVFLQLASALGARTTPPGSSEVAPWTIALRHLRSASALMDTAAASASKPLGYDAAACAAALNAHVRANVTGPMLAQIQSLAAEGDGGLVGGAEALFRVGANESLQARLLHPELLLAAGTAGDAALLGGAALLARRSDASEIHADVRGVVYRLGLMTGDAVAFEALQGAYSRPHKPADGPRLVAGLASYRPASDPGAALALLEPGSTLLKLQDVGSFLARFALSGGPQFFAAWRWVLASGMDALTGRFSPGGAASYSLGRPLKDMLGLLVDNSLKDDMAAFAAKYASVVDPDFLADSRDSVQRNRAWLAGPAAQMCGWLAGTGGGAAAAGGEDAASEGAGGEAEEGGEDVGDYDARAVDSAAQGGDEVEGEEYQGGDGEDYEGGEEYGGGFTRAHLEDPGA
ncbi:hypothetical protein FOA52_000906 [Chlamydomonas sp. UWO 241]|nr:hypothetical protein FOA52_000906 [Chlamydomonas sp. UWO 241]